MSPQEKAGALAEQPAHIKSFAEKILHRKSQRTQAELWQVVADLCAVLCEHEASQRHIAETMSRAVQQLEEIEYELWGLTR
jgi:hypothetical protein